MLILGLVCFIGWFFCEIWTYRASAFSREAAFGGNFLTFIFFSIFFTMLWSLLFFAIGFYMLTFHKVYG